ncbi:MAG: DUF2510 domain-containing protein [Acidimicrobiia bacterium]
MTQVPVAVALVVWVLVGVVGWKVGEAKGRGGLGFVLAMVLGLIGIAIVAFLPPVEHGRADPELLAMQSAMHRTNAPPPPPVFVCRACHQPVLPSATMCRACGKQLIPTALPAPPSGTRMGWLRDPSGRYVDRYWDGQGWSEWVRNDPESADFITDPPVPARV